MSEIERPRVYTKKFKIEAIELYLDSEKTGQEIADNLGITGESLYRWKKE